MQFTSRRRSHGCMHAPAEVAGGRAGGSVPGRRHEKSSAARLGLALHCRSRSLFLPRGRARAMAEAEGASEAEHDEALLPLPSFVNQVAGHKGISHEGGAILVPEPGKIAKPVGRGYFAGEDRFYRALASYPSLAAFCPAYLGSRTIGDRDYVVLEDLTV